jgi:acyl transferase domain-containing protein
MPAKISEGFGLTNSSSSSATGHSTPERRDENSVQRANAANTPIAIVGMALRLPGGIKSSSDLWDMLINKRDGRSTIPNTRYNVEAFHNSSPNKPGSVSMQHGYFLQDDLEYLDAAFFSMNKAEVAKLDPQQRLLLEVVWECMESGGQRNWRGKDIGCYVGVFGEDWLDL